MPLIHLFGSQIHRADVVDKRSQHVAEHEEVKHAAHLATARRGEASGLSTRNDGSLQAGRDARVGDVLRAAIPVTADKERPIERSQKSAELVQHLEVVVFVPRHTER